jgi:pyruvate dehydrogenase E1 component alpha subunit
MISSLTFRPAARRLLAKTASRHAAHARHASSITVDLGADVFSTHNATAPSTTVTTDREELLKFLKQMYTMRRVEITNDTEYKARNIRGFCHLYDGQEAVATGMEAAMTKDDSWITSYRCHCVALLRGSTPEMIFAELFGFFNGTSKGKGGSMHFYSKKHNFFGGQGIVGAQVPVGAGLAFAAKYKTPAGQKSPIAVACYGDGAANQGQIWESANMSKLWDLPMVFVIENNHYGMGTATNRSSCNDHYYTMGGRTIPGIKISGQNVLAVKQGFSMVREFCSSGNGPMFVEFDAYRYHGHSMSDPGTTYRTREEVSGVRQARDPIEYVKKLLVDHNLATADEIKQIEKDIRNSVQESLTAAKAGKHPTSEWLYQEIFATPGPDHKTETQKFIRMPDITKSIVA